MYEVDEKDRVVQLADLPQSSIGAPLPLVLADEHVVVMAYYLEERDPSWDGTTVRIVDPISSDEPVAIVRFRRCRTHMFGPPNDEAFSGHPLAARGLSAYRAFRIENSSWLRKLERMNRVHPNHRPERFWEFQHVVFAFHDSTFECICKEFDVRIRRGAIHNMIPEMVRLLERNAPQ
jgi:hypothetical protein